MNRLGLKISCLLAAVLIWIQVAATSVVESVADLPLRVTGLSEGLTIAGSELPDRVPVRLRGSKLGLMAHKYLRTYAGEMRVNLADRSPGPSFSYQLGVDDVFSESEVLRLDRETRIRLQVDDQLRRRLPVLPVLTGDWPEGVALLVPTRVEPDSIMVTGPARFLAHLDHLTVEPVARDRHRTTTRQRSDVVAPHEHLSLGRSEVEVVLELAPLEERTLANVPVVPLVDAGQLDVSISPPVADVMVRGVADSVRALTGLRVSVTVAVGDRTEGIYLLPGQVDHPPWLTLLGVSPARFRAIVGDPPLDRPPADAPADTTLPPAGDGS